MSPSPRASVMAANWKMHKTVAETRDFFERLRRLRSPDSPPAAGRCEVIVAPPFPSLTAAVEAARGQNISIAAQNLHWEAKGAFTGEVSAAMLVGAGCTHVIIGHSERREYFGETDETVHKKLQSALGAGLRAIVCVGESAAQRENRETEAVLTRQFDGAFQGLDAGQMQRCILAYEPVWAIGTGNVATPALAEDAHRFLRDRARSRFGDGVAASLAILYGGSMKPANVRGLMAEPDIDGGLVGGASLDPEPFAELIAAAAEPEKGASADAGRR